MLLAGAIGLRIVLAYVRRCYACQRPEAAKVIEGGGLREFLKDSYMRPTNLLIHLSLFNILLLANATLRVATTTGVYRSL